jgi:hypothetical protein
MCTSRALVIRLERGGGMPTACLLKDLENSKQLI